MFAFLLSGMLILTISLTACSSGSSSSNSGGTATGGSSSAAESAGQAQSSPSASSKILVAYFSRVGSTNFSSNVDVVTSASLRRDSNGQLVGNTEVVANLVHEAVGGDIFHIETSIPYSSDMAELVKRKNQELQSGKIPELKSKVENLKSYDVVFLGYPIWSGTLPTPVRSFIEENDLSEKTIVPFCTHDGYGPGSSVDVIKQLLPKDTRVLNVFDVSGPEAANADPRIASWLKEIGIVSKS